MSRELLDANAYIGWLHTKSRLNALAPNAKRRLVKRGQVYWCHFGLNIGSEVSKETPRPAIIVQNYNGNQHSPNTIVIPVTHSASTLPCTFQLSPIVDGNGNTVLDGFADASHITSVSKARLTDLIATLTPSQMKEIDKRIAISLDLMRYHDRETQKYETLKTYSDRLKAERNDAQDIVRAVSDLVRTHGFDADFQIKLKKLLDID